MEEPAPSAADLELMIDAAAAAPDHGRLRPTRFVALRGASKDTFGEVLETAYRERCAARSEEVNPDVAQKERVKLGRAPLVLVALTTRAGVGGAPRSAAAGLGRPAARDMAKIPWEERRLSTAAAIENLMLAATSLGYGSMWRTGELVDDPVVKTALGLGVDDDIIGFVYVGTPPPDVHLSPRRLDTDGMLRDWSPA